MKKRIPKFANEQEEAAFWDAHDSSDYLSELEHDDETVFVRPEVGVIEVKPPTWRRLLQEARRKRTTPQRLIERWLKEKLSNPG